jgi:hypothetical protein
MPLVEPVTSVTQRIAWPNVDASAEPSNDTD